MVSLGRPWGFLSWGVLHNVCTVALGDVFRDDFRDVFGRCLVGMFFWDVFGSVLRLSWARSHGDAFGRCFGGMSVLGCLEWGDISLWFLRRWLCGCLWKSWGDGFAFGMS